MYIHVPSKNKCIPLKERRGTLSSQLLWGVAAGSFMLKTHTEKNNLCSSRPILFLHLVVFLYCIIGKTTEFSVRIQSEFQTYFYNIFSNWKMA